MGNPFMASIIIFGKQLDNKLIEYIALFIFVGFFLLLRDFIDNLTVGEQIIIVGTLFGIMHILSANALTELYNQSAKLIPPPFRSMMTLNVGKTRRIGAFVILASFVGWIIN